MTAIRMGGKEVASGILAEVKSRVEARVRAGLRPPHLAVVLAGRPSPATEAYVRGKHRDAEEVGITSSDHRLPETTTQDVVALVGHLNRDPDVSGVLVQQPLPPSVSVPAVVEAVDPQKDVDGFHPISAGRLMLGQPGLVPPTPAGIIRMLDHYGIELEGRRAVVLGRSNIVGKPVSLLLLARHATVTICHSRTVGLADICRQADVLVVAIGRLWFVKPDWVRPGAAVVDVGTNQKPDGKLGGDVDPAVGDVVGWLSPVPGGVGLLTRAMLLSNTCQAEEERRPWTPAKPRLSWGGSPG